MQSLPDSHERDPIALRPFWQRERDPVDFVADIPAGVSGLLFLCCPAAVAGLIVAQVLTPVEGVLWARRFPHVGKKVLKRMSPSFANRDAAPSVARIRCVGHAVAPLKHRSPRSVDARSSHAMRCVSGPRKFCHEAPARLATARTEVSGFDPVRIAAVTQAVPVGSSALAHKILSNQSGKSLASEINKV